ncbi:MAG: riboflavin biosynthesis protein RibF [Candidatus Omnitrophica bacterium]|nr:riboflavin biosynthesis protein RibF [Candidatus Omnitrophota bacterium]
MQVILNAGPLPERYKNVVTAIGVFDGLHRGHQRVISRAVTLARQAGGTSVVVTFFPHPVAILRPHDFQGYVLPLAQRLELIKSLGVDVCYCIPFSRTFARSSAGDFTRAVLVNKLRTTTIVVGEDFHFGNQREGAVDLFARFGLTVEAVPLLKLNRTSIKTRLLKQFIVGGNLPRLKAFLGRDYSVLAEVERGRGVGRRLGFPTANLKAAGLVPLSAGIYVARVMVDAKQYDGVFYCGTRPTINRRARKMVSEVHILDFHGDLYGKKITVEFLKKLRSGRVFPNEAALVRAIARDIVKARDFFSRLPS